MQGKNELWRANGQWQFNGCAVTSIQPNTRVYEQWLECFPALTEPWDLPAGWTP